MKKAFKYIILALVAIVIVGTFVSLYRKSRPEAVSWQQLEATVMDIQKTTVVTGKIEPRNEVEVKPQINGIISEIYKEAGEQVKENEIIAKLKVIPDMASLSSAESRVRLADINLKQAQTNYDREKILYDKDLVSAEEYDQVVQALEQAREERAAAQENLEVIRDGVSSTNATESSTLIRSTITGLILDIPVKVGNSVIQANTMNDGTTVATVADMTDLIFDGNIDETEAHAHQRRSARRLQLFGDPRIYRPEGCGEQRRQPVRDQGRRRGQRRLHDAFRLQRQCRDRAAGGEGRGFSARERA